MQIWAYYDGSTSPKAGQSQFCGTTRKGNKYTTTDKGAKQFNKKKGGPTRYSGNRFPPETLL
jgi:hypothetical protein